MRTTLRSLGVLLLLLVPAAARADHAEMGQDQAKADFLSQYDTVAGKFKSLAEAIPEDKYGWRPAEGVRSVGEVVGHVAGSQYFLLGLAGVPTPADAPKGEDGFEKLGSKAELLAALDRGLAFGRKVAESASSEQLEAKHEVFGKERTGREMFLLVFGHMSEHLGQLIAYARSNGVVPPWSK